MALRPLVLSLSLGGENVEEFLLGLPEVIDPTGPVLGRPESPPRTRSGDRSDRLSCAFCGAQLVSSEQRCHALAPACPLCFLCRHLERPPIDEEAVLVWLPEMSQGALNVMIRQIHIELRVLGEDVYDVWRLRLDTPERRKLYHARAALSARTATAAGRLGTDKPSELARALYRLSPGAYANRAKLLYGLRLLPLGRFYEGGRDVYPDVVDAWRELSGTPLSPPSSRPAPPSGA